MEVFAFAYKVKYAVRMEKKPVCGRCGVYRHLHPTDRCERSRREWPWDTHYLHRHVVGTIWLALPERARWRIVGWYHKARPHLCWCDLVDAAYQDIKKDDYRKPYGCACDVTLPTDAGSPRPGWCYCPPAA